MRKVFETLWSFFAMALMIVGVGGLLFHTFRDDGWLEHFGGIVWDWEVRNPLMATPIIIAALWLGWLALGGRLVVGRSNKGADLLVFALVFIGIYFVYEWLNATIS